MTQQSVTTGDSNTVKGPKRAFQRKKTWVEQSYVSLLPECVFPINRPLVHCPPPQLAEHCQGGCEYLDINGPETVDTTQHAVSVGIHSKLSGS